MEVVKPKAIGWNQRTIEEWHAKKGRGVGMWGDHVLLMTATGAKSGDLITTPLVFGRDGDDYIIVASKGGAPANPTWFNNLKKNPKVEVEAPVEKGIEKFTARARVIEDRAERDRLFKKMITIWPSYADYEKRTERLIPVLLLSRQG